MVEAHQVQDQPRLSRVKACLNLNLCQFLQVVLLPPTAMLTWFRLFYYLSNYSGFAMKRKATLLLAGSFL